MSRQELTDRVVIEAVNNAVEHCEEEGRFFEENGMPRLGAALGVIASFIESNCDEIKQCIHDVLEMEVD